jgi:hypothetical protein
VLCEALILEKRICKNLQAATAILLKPGETILYSKTIILKIRNFSGAFLKN